MAYMKWIALVFLLFCNKTFADINTANRLYKQAYYADAFDEYLQLAKQGNVEAQAKLALMYFGGRGVFRDDASAFNWSIQAAKKGNADAQYLLGYLFENGLSIPKDIKRAIHWYQRAADQANPEAMANLANLYIRGIDVAKNNLRGLKLAKRAAQMNNRYAQYLLGLLYNSTYQDYSLGKYWLNQSAEKGYAESANELGMIYFTGQGERQNLPEALFWFIVAEELNAPAGGKNRQSVQIRVSKSENLLAIAKATQWLETHSEQWK